MAPSPVSPIFDALALQRQVYRLFEEMMRQAGPFGSASPAMAPRLDMSERGQEVRIEIELPGVSEQDVHLELAGDVLTISGEKRSARDDAQHHVSERSFGAFTRSVRLPCAPRPDHVRAAFANGVLTIALPKAETGPQVHRIPIQHAAAAGQSSAIHDAAALAGHPTPHTTRAGAAQAAGGGAHADQGSATLNDHGQAQSNPVLNEPGPGHPT